MEIERINTYNDDRFSQEVLLEPGAFLVDGYHPCSFKICDDYGGRSIGINGHDVHDQSVEIYS